MIPACRRSDSPLLIRILLSQSLRSFGLLIRSFLSGLDPNREFTARPPEDGPYIDRPAYFSISFRIASSLSLRTGANAKNPFNVSQP